MKDDSLQTMQPFRVCLESEERWVVLSFYTSGNKIAETSRHYPTKSRPNICDEY